MTTRLRMGHTHPVSGFYQRTYKDDVDLEEKLAVWERFYYFDRPHGAHGGKTP